jgi:hypothetical protein
MPISIIASYCRVVSEQVKYAAIAKIKRTRGPAALASEAETQNVCSGEILDAV